MSTERPEDEVPPLPAYLAPPPEQEALELGLEAAVFDPLDADAVALKEAGDTEAPPLRAYLLLDASASPDIPVCIEAFDSPARCLFDGAAFDELAEVGPWLVELRRYADAWDWFVEDGYGSNWGIIIFSRLELLRLKVQMKKFIKIEDEDGQTHFFKFYRPRHFNTYIPAFDKTQLASFSRGVAGFMAEDGTDRRTLRRHVPQDGLLQTDLIDLVALGEPRRIQPPSPDEAQALIASVIAEMETGT